MVLRSGQTNTVGKPHKAMKITLFKNLPIGYHFRIPGFDSLLIKESNTTAKDCGCGFLTRPVRFSRKGSATTIHNETEVQPCGLITQ